MTDPPTRGPTRWLVVVIAWAVLIVPSIGYLLGARGTPIENRTATAFPEPDAGWGFVTGVHDYVADRLPIRSLAVRADAWIDWHVFGEDPAFGGAASPRVLQGEDGFLFVADAITESCTPYAPVDRVVANLSDLARIVAASGRRVVTMVAPDKSTVHPELLPSGPTIACAAAGSDALWSALDAAGIAGFVDLRRKLVDESNETREPLFLRKDSHWDSRGSLVMVQALVDALAPGLFRDDEVVYSGLADYTGDLTNLRGAPEVDQAPQYTVRRPDIDLGAPTAIDHIEGRLNRRFVNDGPPGRLIEGRTVMFLDSFGLRSLTQYVPYFRDLTVVRLVDFPVASNRFLELIDDADQVVILSVERSTRYRMVEEIGSDDFRRRLAAAIGPDGD